MKIPGPDHPITLEASPRRVRAKFDNHVIADTDDALILREASYPPVYYFPKDHVEMGFFGRTDHSTQCPYKGDATYWTLTMEGDIAENVAWSYEDPFPAVAPTRAAWPSTRTRWKSMNWTTLAWAIRTPCGTARRSAERP